MTALGSWAFGLLLVAGGGFDADERVDKIPKEIQQAEKTLTRWLDGFNDQTPEQVRKSLGAPVKEITWLYEEKKEPLLKYKIGDSTELSLYFAKGRVVKVGLHLLP